MPSTTEPGTEVPSAAAAPVPGVAPEQLQALCANAVRIHAGHEQDLYFFVTISAAMVAMLGFVYRTLSIGTRSEPELYDATLWMTAASIITFSLCCILALLVLRARLADPRNPLGIAWVMARSGAGARGAQGHRSGLDWLRYALRGTPVEEPAVYESHVRDLLAALAATAKDPGWLSEAWTRQLLVVSIAANDRSRGLHHVRSLFMLGLLLMGSAITMDIVLRLR